MGRPSVLLSASSFSSLSSSQERRPAWASYSSRAIRSHCSTFKLKSSDGSLSTVEAVEAPSTGSASASPGVSAGASRSSALGPSEISRATFSSISVSIRSSRSREFRQRISMDMYIWGRGSGSA